MNRVLAPAALALVLVACAPATPAKTDDGTTSPPASSPTSAPDEGGSMGDMDQAMIDALIEQAAADTGVSADEIGVVSAEAVTWSDGSIGCPQEGMAYTQALVPGFRVVLDVAGEEFHYHAASDGLFFACDNPQEPIDGAVDR